MTQILPVAFNVAKVGRYYLHFIRLLMYKYPEFLTLMPLIESDLHSGPIP